MEGGKKVVGMIVLLAAIAAVIVYTVKRSTGPPSQPDHVRNREITKIDSNTNTVVVKTLGEWQDLGHKEGKYKNPETGEYTMVRPMTCDSCDKQIPAPEMPANIADLGAEGEDEINANYMCPLCAEHAFP
jgi:hypothetical protein